MAWTNPLIRGSINIVAAGLAAVQEEREEGAMKLLRWIDSRDVHVLDHMRFLDYYTQKSNLNLYERRVKGLFSRITTEKTLLRMIKTLN